MSRRTLPPYRTLRELVGRHAGWPAVILGGGPSLPEQVAKCDLPGAVFISANDHGCKLRKCDYIVALDKIEPRLRPFGVPIIGRHMWADYRILESPAPSSGIAAAFVALIMGCKPIIPCGMDCYSGETYWHDARARSNGFTVPPRTHLARWREYSTRFPGPYRAVGGPLADIFPPYDPHECPFEYIPFEVLERSCAGLWVEFRTQTDLKGRTFQAGEIVEVSQKEAANLIEKRKARFVQKPQEAA